MLKPVHCVMPVWIEGLCQEGHPAYKLYQIRTAKWGRIHILGVY